MKVFLGIPTHNGTIRIETLDAVLRASKQKNLVHVEANACSVLPRGFNRLLCNALNGEFSHFCLLHADIKLGPWWLDHMLKIMKEEDSGRIDVLSVVSPLKSFQGLTSTALDEPCGGLDPRYNVRRLTIREIAKRPATWTESNLLVNTACMLVKLGPWVWDLSFDFDETIQVIDGKRVALGLSEDWLFSRQARLKGASIWVTRAIKLEHIGPHAYSNQGEWGSLSIDGPLPSGPLF